ncbi:class I SAM-dependent DNA methyltransferase [Halalkalibacillus halophilus]|uniref:class I SAM-dependent DNA methyltransferase n=1 Tax=Halalkalibacillus halophilus TaxID=392827 RepID=UPI0006847357|nr:class I SAM-dependent methyltransferase [Halalkalibacillus halophilus]
MYQSLATVYDELMKDAPYENWVEFTKSCSKESISDLTILELGCGTGEIATRLAREGSKITAIDQSEEMINLAKEKAMKSNLDITFDNKDIRSYQTDKSFDLILSYCDVINYLLTEEDVRQTFQQAFHHLSENGQFLFDVHSLSYIHELTDNEIFSQISEEVSYVWFCKQGETENQVEHDLTFFVQKEADLYKRFDEVHTQQVFPMEKYKELLQEVGFTEVEFSSDFSLTKATDEQTNRFFFRCRK